MKCNKCLKDEEPTITTSGKHQKASCAGCGAYIKFVSQGLPPTFYFGKYAGKTMAEVALLDLEYMHWMYGETKSAKLKTQIDETLKRL